MTLLADIQTIVPTTRLRDLTRDEGEEGTATVDTTKLTSACNAAEAKWERWTGLNFDDTNADHIDWGVQYTLVTLQYRKGILDAAAAKTEFDRLKEDAESLRERQRVPASTNSQATVNTDRTRDVDRRHPMRPEHWDGYRGRSVFGEDAEDEQY